MNEMNLTVKHLRALLAQPECRDEMPIVIESHGFDFNEHAAEAARIDTHDQLVITVDAPNSVE